MLFTYSIAQLFPIVIQKNAGICSNFAIDGNILETNNYETVTIL